MIIDNLNQINKVCDWAPGAYYKFVCIIRSKDGIPILHTKENKKQIVVKYWLIGDRYTFDKLVDDMIQYCDLFGARLYVTTDRKSIKKSLFQVVNRTNHYLEQLCNGNSCDISPNTLNKLISSISSISESTDNNLGSKRWLYDIDSKNISTLNSVIDLCKEYHIATLDTLNGYHVIANRQYSPNQELPKDVEIKSNALTLLYKTGE